MEETRESILAEGMLRRAEKDLKVFRRNYRRRNFAHALTNMQQAVEKFGKSVLLAANQCTEKDLKNNIGHKLVDFLIKIIRKILDELVAVNPELELGIRKIVDKFQSDYKQKYKISDNLFIEFKQLKNLLKDYGSFEGQIRTGTMLMINDFPMQLALEEFFQTSDNFLNQIEHQYDLELTDEQRMEARIESLEYVTFGEYFREVQNTLYTILLLVYVAILSVNLEKHASSSRYDVNDEIRYSKKSEIVKALTLMNETMKKMIETYYHLIILNLEVEEVQEK